MTGKKFIVIAMANISFFVESCNNFTEDNTIYKADPDTTKKEDSIARLSSTNHNTTKIIIHDTLPSITIDTSKASPESIVQFAETLIGTPYKYGSADAKYGFDCSGFITYVFNHFNITVPRSSIDFTNVGSNVPLKNAKRGDLILFTGTDSTEKFVGHMGIITFSANDSLQFIHSTSGKAYGVTVTPLNDYYKGRFVKVIRI
jgi:cell wall-associated NlpC family hydrolase